MTTFFSFLMPGSADETWSDEALKNLIGQECTVSLFGEPECRYTITEAGHRTVEPFGVWLTVGPKQ